ncbi:TetR/AcrR family transcriptional regulator C-terminal domain-containing protein [Streptomyces sp. WMMC500]|uniref:TetR/AcrR family transcriptional regulator C-terminal domain-containing protein n=1 Tax=Streptomyces sp. WMMC500 TaxID=3015154 RepID=UPI00248CB7F7|nr:TetR/AcrR family transcriptional regulator C-terminal domain-containing protein [Streptomyces sp. WMMC500]WBB60224.1 TetR/AcrR family transcriptional regulator C-terminal domain-containing protein [Streptomyces sp. WMMC500]
MAASGRAADGAAHGATPEVIWTRPERAGRGPRPAHSRAAIAAAAVRIADADGLDAVSMRRVAAEIGSGTMSLYNYVPRKEDLHELMVDAVSAEYDLSAPLTGDWRADVLALAEQSRELMRRHPWLPRLTATTAYGFTPHALRYLDRFLAALEGLDAAPGTKMELVAMVTASVTSYVTFEIALAERARALPWSEAEEQAVRGAYLAGQLATGEYPHLAAVLAQAAEPGDHDEAFRRMLGRALDGFEPPGGAAPGAGTPGDGVG